MERNPRRLARCNARVQVLRSAIDETTSEPHPKQPVPDPLETLIMELLSLAKTVAEDKKAEILAFANDVIAKGGADLAATLQDIASLTGVSFQIVHAVFHEAGVLAAKEVGMTLGVSTGGGSLRIEIDIGRRQSDKVPVERKVLLRQFMSFRDITVLLIAMIGSGVGWLVVLGKVLACLVLFFVLFPVAILIGYGARKAANWSLEFSRLRPKPLLAHATV